MICPKCGNEFTNRSYSELCPHCDCGLSGCQITSPPSAPGGGLIGQCPQAEQLNENQKNTRLLSKATHDYKFRRDAREKVLEKIANMVLSCVWSDAPDCPGAEGGECICDGCPRFEYMDMEDFREYIREELRKKDGEP